MTTWYIDPSAGVDGSGTEASPFNTWASVTWSANDTYLQKAGTTFRGTVTVGANSVTLNRYGVGVDPIITGADTDATFSGPDGNGNYESVTTYTNPTFVIKDGTAIQHGASEAALGANEWFYENVANTVVLGFDPSSNTIEVGVRGVCVDCSTRDGVVIKNYRFEGCRAVSAQAGVLFDSSAAGSVEGCSFYACRGGVDVRTDSTDVHVFSCTFDLVVAGVDYNRGGGNKPSDCVVQNCSFVGTYPTDGTDVSDWMANVWTTQGASEDSEGIAGTGPGSNIKVLCNWIREYQDAIYFLFDDAQTGLEIKGNYVETCDDEGIQVGTLDNATASYTCEIVGNTVRSWGHPGDDAGAPSSYGIIVGTRSDATATSTATIRNNTMEGWANNFQAEQEMDLSFDYNVSAGPLDDGSEYHVNLANVNAGDDITALDRNAYEGAHGWRWPSADSGSYTTTFATWQSQGTGISQDANGINQTLNLNNKSRPDPDSGVIALALAWWSGEPEHGEDGLRYFNAPSAGAYEPRNKSGYARGAAALVANTLPAGVDIARAKVA